MGTITQAPASTVECAWLGSKGYNASEAPVYSDGKVFWLGVTGVAGTTDATNGRLRLNSYELATSTHASVLLPALAHTPPNQDDHNSGGLVVDGSGNLIVTYGSRGGAGMATDIGWARVSPALSITASGIEDFAGSVADFLSLEYTSMVRLSSTGTTYVFGRDITDPDLDGVWGGDYRWVPHMVSTDDFATYAVTNDRALSVDVAGVFGTNGTDRIYCAMFKYGASAEIWYLEMDENGTFYDVDGAAIGYDFDTLDLTGIPTASMSSVVPHEDGYSFSVVQVCRDGLDRPLIVWQKTAYPSDATTHYVLYTTYYNGSAWVTATLCDTGLSINDSLLSANGALGMVDERYPFRAFVAREQTVGGGEWEIESYTTSDYATWTLESDLTAATGTLPVKLARPAVVKDYPGSPIVLFLSFTDRNTYADWDGFSNVYIAAAGELPTLVAVADTDHIDLTYDFGTGPYLIERRVV